VNQPTAIGLRERVAIVTGAGRGIGRAYALRLAAYGARVIVNDAGVATDGGSTAEDPAADVVAEISSAGGEAIAQRGDIGDARVADELVQRALDSWGRLDIVINNAGFGRPRMVFNLADDEWDDVIRVHLRGTFVVSRPACRHWRAQAKEHGTTYGRLINTATGLLLYGGAGQSNYVAAKAGINAFTEAVATEMAPYGVTANSIMPGANTRLAQIGWRTQRSIDDEGGTEEARAMRDPVHVAELGCFLASPEAAGISGQTFQVHGGTIEHVQTWRVIQTWQRDDGGFRADELAEELPLDAGPKVADRPPPEWTASRDA
jgi:NAD(P)-dependent dehydrogenase (short-subunit alcohol dehydrogenase family)